MSSRSSTPAWQGATPEAPRIEENEPFAELVRKLSFYFVAAIDTPSDFEELRRSPSGKDLEHLVTYLTDNVHHEAVVAALLALKCHFATLENEDDYGVNETRGYACELVAWRFVTNLSEREAIDYLCYEYHPETEPTEDLENGASEQASASNGNSEHTPLLRGVPKRPTTLHQRSQSGSMFGTARISANEPSSVNDGDFVAQFKNLNALEIAAVAEAKKFLSQKVVQKVVNGIWRGDIIFWEALSVHATKKARVYNKRRADIFCRLRVPRYLKAFEMLFFIIFLALYYTVLVQKIYGYVTPAEVLLYVWIAGFAYAEIGDMLDAGQMALYVTDFWFMWDIGIVAIGTAFFVLRVVGLCVNSYDLEDTAFDILALEALLLFPRICSSLLSLNSYYGTLIPCLKEMTKDFVKFLSLVLILYLGFLTAFTMLARGQYTASKMSWILVQVFFGSSYLGFEIASIISPVLGRPLMLIFVCLTNILLITSLISLLSNSLAKILDHAREEFLFGYSVYVLEASTSNRLTYYLPPLNLLVLLFRPLRLFASSEQLRSARITVLRMTHFPYIAAIWAFEHGSDYLHHRSSSRSSSRNLGAPEGTMSLKRGVLIGPSPKAPRTLAPSSAAHASSGDGSLPGRSQATALQKAPAASSNSEDEESTRQLVLKLSSQVETLTAMVTQLQQGGQQAVM